MQYLRIEEKNNYAIFYLDRGKSNPLNNDFCVEIRAAIANAQKSTTIKGVIIAGKENFFSAGLDVPEIATYNKETFAIFWDNFMLMTKELIQFTKPLVAAITGHAPAGGCIIAIACDYRVMADGNFKIGLNEIPIGIVVPKGIFDTYAFWIGQKTAYQYLMEGKMYNPTHAKEIGLIDEIVEANLVIETAEKKLMQYLSYEQNGWQITKAQLKSSLVKSMNDLDKQQMEILTAQWWTTEVRAILDNFVQSLKKK